MSHSTTAVREAVRDLALSGVWPELTVPRAASPLVHALRAAGSEPWLDTGDRGAAAAVWCAEMSGLTTNNTLVNQVIQTGALDEPLAEAARRLRAVASDLPEEEFVRELGFVANARVALDLVRSFGVRVSVELHPATADDPDATVEWGRRYYALCPESFIVKVPLTPAGYLAVRRLSSEAIPVNFTLGFSARQNVLAALLARPAFVNVFLGRLNAVVKDNGHGSGDSVGERACLASDAWMKRLRVERGTPTRQIAASMRSGEQVRALAGVDVHTIPPKALAEYLALAIDPSEVHAAPLADLPVEAEIDLDTLWEVPAEFLDFATRADQEGETITPRELCDLARRYAVGDLFHPWTPEECAEIRADGKIPTTAKWLGRVALDDLMTRSALESFITDQQALDNRLRGLL